MQIFEPSIYHIVYWSGQITTLRLRIDSFLNDVEIESHYYHSAMAANQKWDRIFCCTMENNFLVSEYQYEHNEDKKSGCWQLVQELASYENYEKEPLLQLKLDQNERMLLGTAGKGFIVWNFGVDDSGAIYLALPHGVRNISTRMMSSNSIMISSKFDYAIAGVRYSSISNAKGKYILFIFSCEIH